MRIVFSLRLEYNQHMTKSNSEIKWSFPTKLLISTFLIVIFIYSLVRFSVLIPPLVLAGILAYVLSPIVSRLERRFKFSRAWATVLIYLVLISIAALVPVLIIPILVDQIALLNLDFQHLISTIENWLVQTVTIVGVSIDLGQIVEQGISSIQALLEPIFGQTLEIALDVIGPVVWIIFTLVISSYLVKDGSQFKSWLKSKIPLPYARDFSRINRQINCIWREFFRGQLTLALVVAVIFSIGGLALGIPYAFARAILAGFLEFIPSVGHGIWLITASILLFLEGSTWMPLQNWVIVIIVIILHLIFQQIDLNYLIPRIIGRRMHLHPLVVILGIIFGAAVAGVLDLVLATPTISSVRVVGVVSLLPII
jgi:predicted PurR-regulated permease PerM